MKVSVATLQERNLPDSRYGVEISGLPEEAFVSDVRHGQSSVLDSGINVIGQGTEPFEMIVRTEGAASLAGVGEFRVSQGL